MDAVTFSTTKTGKVPEEVQGEVLEEVPEEVPEEVQEEVKEEVQEASISSMENWTNQISSLPVGFHQMLLVCGL